MQNASIPSLYCSAIPHVSFTRYTIAARIVTGVTVGKVNDDAQVLAGAVIMGAAGNITTLTVLLASHDPVPIVPVAVLPHAAVKI